MTIFLPSDFSLFHKAFDEACDRILLSKQDRVFYALLIQLIAQIRQHAFFRQIIGQFQEDLLAKQIEFSKISHDYHEYNWKKLWQYHRRSYKHRRELIHIKRMITYPRETSSSSLHNRLGCAMWEFRAFGFISCSPSAIKVFFREKIDEAVDQSNETQSKNEFCHRSSFFRLIEEAPQIFRRAQSNIQLGINIAKHLSPSKEKITIRQKNNAL